MGLRVLGGICGVEEERQVLFVERIEYRIFSGLRGGGLEQSMGHVTSRHQCYCGEAVRMSCRQLCKHWIFQRHDSWCFGVSPHPVTCANTLCHYERLGNSNCHIG